MVIVHVVEPFAAGIATFIKLLAENMPDDCHIVVHGERKEVTEAIEVKKYFPKNNVKFIRWKSAQREISLLKDLKALVELTAILKRFKHADAIHLHSSKAGFLGRVGCSMVGIDNVIYTPNGAPFLIEDISSFRTTLYKRLEQVGAVFGGKVVCTSRSERKAYAKIGIRASYINNGTVQLEKEDLKKIKNKNEFIISTVGRIADQKNPELFNEIAQRFVEFENIKFMWIGDGSDRETLTAPNIIITGWISQEQVKRTIEKSNLYLSTSKYEGLPLSVLEAMSLKRCLLLKDCVGNRDLVRSGKNGELFTTVDEAEQHILNFYTYLETTRKMGEYSYELCAKYFDVIQTAERYKEEYMKFLQIPDIDPKLALK